MGAEHLAHSLITATPFSQGGELPKKYYDDGSVRRWPTAAVATKIWKVGNRSCPSQARSDPDGARHRSTKSLAGGSIRVGALECRRDGDHGSVG
jgi:hypothetical protein